MSKKSFLFIFGFLLTISACSTTITDSSVSSVDNNSILSSDNNSSNEEVTKSYHIYFTGYNDQLLYEQNVKDGELPVYNGSTPTRPSTNTNTYTFIGWEPNIEVAHSNRNYVAKFEENVRYYTLNYYVDDEIYVSEQYEYDSVVLPVDTPDNLVIDNLTYVFQYWSDSNGNQIDLDNMRLREDLNVYAKYALQSEKYQISFLNYNGTLLETVVVNKGEIPSCSIVPTRDRSDEFEYSFTGWDKEIVSATKDETYTATFSASTRKYAVTLYNDDGSMFDQLSVNYGTVPTITNKPTKSPTAQYSYTFVGWAESLGGALVYPDGESLPVVHNEASYYAVFSSELNKYTVSFRELDETELDSKTLDYGAYPSYSGTIQKVIEGTTYTLGGWYMDNDRSQVLTVLPSVSKNTIYYAYYTTTVNKYNVQFTDSDGETILYSNEYQYGVVPSYEGMTTPSKENTAQYTYVFDGWSTSLDGEKLDELLPVNGNMTYYPHFEVNVNKYKISFYNEDNSLIEEKLWEYGTLPSCSVTPTKESTAQYDYVFSGWDKEVTEVTGETNYVACYTEHLRSYLISFYGYDGSLIESTNYSYGSKPSCSIVPTKPSSDLYYYTFAGWSLVVDGEITEIDDVSGATNYYAVFEEHLKAISIINGSTELTYGETMNLEILYDGVEGNVTWESLTPSTCSVDSNGVVTTLDVGNATIRATLDDNHNIFSEFSFVIIAPDPTSINIGGIVDGGTYAQGDELDLTVDVSPTKSDQSVSWTSGGALIDNSGHVTFNTVGTTTITATSNALSTVSKDVTVNVVDPTKVIVLSNANIPSTLGNSYNTSVVSYSTFGHEFQYLYAKKDEQKHVSLNEGGYILSDAVNGFNSVTVIYSGSGELVLYSGYHSAEEKVVTIVSGEKILVEGNYMKIYCKKGEVSIDKVTINYSNTKLPIMNTGYYSGDWDFTNLLSANPSFKNRTLSSSENANAIHSYAVFNGINSQYYMAEATIQLLDYSPTDTWSRVGIGIFDSNNSYHGLVVSPGQNGDAKKTVVIDSDVYGNIYNWTDGTTDRSQIWWGHDINYKIFNQTIDNVDHSYKTPFKMTFVRNGNAYYYFINDMLWWKEELYLNYDGIPTQAALVLGEAQAVVTNISALQGKELVENYLENKSQKDKKLYSFYEYSTVVSADDRTITFTGNYDSFKNNAAYSIGDAFRFDSGYEGTLEFDFVVNGYNSSSGQITYPGSVTELNNQLGVSFIRYDHANDGTKTCLISQNHMGFTGWNKDSPLPDGIPDGIGAWDPIGQALDFSGNTTYHVRIDRLIDETGRDDYRLTLLKGGVVLHSKTWGWYDSTKDPCPVTIAFHSRGLKAIITNITKIQADTRKVPLKDAQVVLLMGQSNMEGHSHTSYLNSSVGNVKAAEYNNGYPSIRIAFASNVDQNSGGEFVTTRTNLGLNNGRFGPEVGIAEKLEKETFENGQVFLIKFALGSTDLYDEWRSPSSGRVGWMYSNAMSFHRNMLNKLRWMGYNPVVKAICWMQGEDDSASDQYVHYKNYENALISDLRSNFGYDVAFIDGGISAYSAWVHYVEVNNAKQELANEDPLHDYIQTIDGYTTTTEPSEVDPYHYDSASMIKLGNSFGDCILKYLN